MLNVEDIKRGYYLNKFNMTIDLYHVVAETIDDEWCLHCVCISDTSSHDYI